MHFANRPKQTDRQIGAAQIHRIEREVGEARNCYGVICALVPCPLKFGKSPKQDFLRAHNP